MELQAQQARRKFPYCRRVARRHWPKPTNLVSGRVAGSGRDQDFGRMLDGRHVSERAPTILGRPKVGPQAEFSPIFLLAINRRLLRF